MIDEAEAAGSRGVDYDALMKALTDSKCTRYERTKPSVKDKVTNLNKRQGKGAATRKRRGQKNRAGAGGPAHKKKKGA